MRTAALLILGLYPVMASTAAAQPGYGYGGYVDNKAATVGESYARGVSDVIRSRGAYEVDHSQARINDAQARSAEMDNRMQYTNDYFERRNINKTARFGNEAQRAAQREKNNQNRLFRYGQEGQPTRLTSRELDPITGEITWPIALEAPDFKEHRDEIDRTFVKRAESHSRFTYGQYQLVQNVCKQIDGALRAAVKTLDPQDWVQARNFVKRVSVEARHAAS